MRRLALLVIGVLVAGIVTAGSALAQPSTAPPTPPRPTVTVPTQSPTLNSDPDPDGSQFDETYDGCKDLLDQGLHTGLDWLDEAIDVTVGGLSTINCGVAAGAMTAGVNGVQGLATLFWDDPVGKLTRAVMDGNKNAFVTMMTFWMSVPIPFSGSQSIGGIRNLTWELQLIALAFGVGFGALRLAIARRHAVAEGAEESARMLMRTLFALWTLPVTVLALHQAGDGFSIWVLQSASGGDVNAKIQALVWIDEKSGLGPVVSLALAGIGLLGSIAQLVALIIREAVLSLAVALSPIAAAASVTGTGRQSWTSMISYTIAALLFKPAASLLYAFAFWAATSNTATDAVIGAVLLAVAGFALPTILRVIAPSVSTISAGGSQVAALAAGGGAAAGAAGMAARAAGAKMQPNGGGSAGSAAGSGGSPPASGSTGGYGGQYSGSSSGGGGGGGSRAGGGGGSGGGGSATRSGSSASGSAGTSKAATAAKLGGMALAGIGTAAVGTARAASRGTSSAAGFIEGTIQNGQVPR
ncbi:hypothetical protein [Nocardia suismassiliense]|uniref:hypothetical protein n=1 Tax=Nocardia suismassiliense TaxID=2077092 RepID=UPI00131EF1E1|nr:hypothetical protein [Nocardia suismassiliense]